MLTIFSIPKAFNDEHIKVIQRNAIKSWKNLECGPQVILLGDDYGVAETAKELGVQHIANIKKNRYGTPLLNSAFNIAINNSINNVLVYVNSDVILTSSVIEAINKIKLEKYLIAGRRIDFDVDEEIDFLDKNWESKILRKVKNGGIMHGFSGIDYFIFPKNFNHGLPDFAVGRIGWDNSFIFQAKARKVPVIDGTEIIIAIHQNHRHFQKAQNFYRIEKAENVKMAGGLINMLTLREADLILTKDVLIQPKFPRILFAKLSPYLFFRLMLLVKRKIDKILKREYK